MVDQFATRPGKITKGDDVSPPFAQFPKNLRCYFFFEVFFAAGFFAAFLAGFFVAMTILQSNRICASEPAQDKCMYRICARGCQAKK